MRSHARTRRGPVLLLGGLALCAAVLLAGRVLHSPAPKVPLVGYLSAGTPQSAVRSVESFRQGLRDHGYAEGETIRVEYRYAEGDVQRSPQLAAALVAQQVDVLVTPATQATLAAMRATETIPIVFVSVSDPVGQGIVCTLRQPCGNARGLRSVATSETNGLRLQLLKELLGASNPRLTRVAMLGDATNPASGASSSPALNAAAAALGLQLQFVQAQGAPGLPAAFAQMRQGGAEAFLDAGCPMTCTNAARVVQLAAQHRLPGFYQFRIFVENGGLISYGQDDPAMFRRSGGYVDKLLKGATPADLPVEDPTTFDFLVCQPTAQSLGLWPLPRTIQDQVTQLLTAQSVPPCA
jgi:putative tryptophan/tyrosine transport system substrate-binding protein